MSSGELARLNAARMHLRDKVLLALMSPDTTETINAWMDVDKAAVELAKWRRAYDKHIREVVKNAQRRATKK